VSAPGQASAGQAAYEAWAAKFGGKRDAWDELPASYRAAWEAAGQAALAAQEPDAAPELLLGPCPFEGHDGEHLRLNTRGHWLCAITLTNMLVAADVIADPAPDVTKLRAELDELTGYHDELANDILLNAPESFDGDEAAGVIAVRYVRHLEAERDRLAGGTVTIDGQTFPQPTPPVEPQTAPGLAKVIQDWRDTLAELEPVQARDGDQAMAAQIDTLRTVIRQVEQATATMPAPTLGTAWRLLNQLRAAVTALAEDLEHSAKATAPSKKSAIEETVAQRLRILLEGK